MAAKITTGQTQHYTKKTKDRGTRTPLKQGVHSCAPEGYAIPAPQEIPVVLLLSNTNIIRYGSLATLAITKSKWTKY